MQRAIQGSHCRLITRLLGVVEPEAVFIRRMGCSESDKRDGADGWSGPAEVRCFQSVGRLRSLSGVIALENWKWIASS
jgi:hypothetical protein